MTTSYEEALDTPPPLEAAEYTRQVLAERPARRRRVRTMQITVWIHHEGPLTRDHIAEMTRHTNGTVEHDPDTGMVTLSWRSPADRVLGVAATAPRVASLALMAAFGYEPEVVSITVSYPDKH
jgi:hypothetical protein